VENPGDRKPASRDWESWIDQQIREAQEQGAFDNLPGKGHPIDLTSNPFAQDQELAFKILQDAGYAPEWIELDKAIRQKLVKAQAALARARSQRSARLKELPNCADLRASGEREQALTGWRRAVATFEDEVQAINREIAALNLKVPSPRFQRPKIDADREIARLEEQST